MSLYSLRHASIWWRDLSTLGNEFTGEEAWFRRVTRLRVGRGDKVRFWKDSWCGPAPFCELFPDLYEACRNKNGEVQQFGMWTDGRWRWSINVAGDNASRAYLNDILRDVSLCVHRDDVWVWCSGSKQQFSVKECYNWLMNSFAGSQIGDELAAACDKLWKTNVPTKAKVLVWRLFIERLPTRDALARRGVPLHADDTVCVGCLSEPESANHVFFRCSLAKDVWRKVCLWAEIIDINEIDTVSHFCRFGQQLGGRKLKRMKFMIWIATVWALWNARNRKIFQGVECNINNIVTHVKMISWGWFSARGEVNIVGIMGIG